MFGDVTDVMHDTELSPQPNAHVEERLRFCQGTYRGFRSEGMTYTVYTIPMDFWMCYH